MKNNKIDVRLERLAYIICVALFEKEVTIDFEKLLNKSETELAKMMFMYVRPLDIPKLYDSVAKVKQMIRDYKAADRNERLMLAGKLIVLIGDSKKYFKDNVKFKYPRGAGEMMRVLDKAHALEDKKERKF